MPGSVRVHLSHATGLRAADPNGLSDPYIKIKLGGLVETGPTIKATLNPRFDWDFRFAFKSVERALEGTSEEVEAKKP